MASRYRSPIDPHPPRRRWWPRWLRGLVSLAAVVCLVAWLITPLVRRSLEFAADLAGGVVATVLVGAAAAADTAYELACDRALGSEQLGAIVGAPMNFPPLEQVRFITASDPDSLEFEFQISGPLATVDAHAVVQLDGNAWTLTHMHATGRHAESFEIAP